MTTKFLLTISVLALATVGIASAKSYYFTLTAPAKVGAVTLKPGEYQVSVKGTNAVLTADSGKSYTIPVKVAQSDKKFDSTSAVTAAKDGGDSLTEVDLGDSTTKLQFGQ